MLVHVRDIDGLYRVEKLRGVINHFAGKRAASRLGADRESDDLAFQLEAADLECEREDGMKTLSLGHSDCDTNVAMRR